jgi:1-acyl-sn-glycerol-3-phosphate acyltransferase
MDGLATARLRYPFMSAEQQRRAMRRWSGKLLSILSVVVPAEDRHHPMPPRCVIVSNHVSWMDIFVLAANYPAVFVAKSEIRHWPLVGWLCQRAGTLFIERGRSSSAKRTNETIAAAINGGSLVCIYPEGTTTDGKGLARFHAALFQPAIDSLAIIQPVVLRYRDRQGNYCGAPNFVGETTFVQSLWHITAARQIVADLQFLEPLSSADRDRRALASEAHSAIAAALALEADGNPPGKAGGHPA